MAGKKEEYDSLRQELIEHQSKRLPIMGTALTVSTILFGVGVELKNPYLPLFALLMLHSARVQLAQAHYGVQRIAAYIRVMHEEDNPELNWETGSYRIRLESLQKPRSGDKKSIWNISPLSPLDSLILLTDIAAVTIAFMLSGDLTSKVITGIVAFIGLAIWLAYSLKLQDLRSMAIDQREEKYWREFKQKMQRERDADENAK